MTEALTTQALDALRQFVADHEASGFYCAGLNAAYRQALRVLFAASGGKLSGAATTTIKIRNYGDSADRITATVDADGNRSAVTFDLT